jgi:hypothetical protein
MPESLETAARALPTGVLEKQEPVWDDVAEASWESFPASDSPVWIGRRSEQPSR